MFFPPAIFPQSAMQMQQFFAIGVPCRSARDFTLRSVGCCGTRFELLADSVYVRCFCPWFRALRFESQWLCASCIACARSPCQKIRANVQNIPVRGGSNVRDSGSKERRIIATWGNVTKVALERREAAFTASYLPPVPTPNRHILHIYGKKTTNCFSRRARFMLALVISCFLALGRTGWLLSK